MTAKLFKGLFSAVAFIVMSVNCAAYSGPKVEKKLPYSKGLNFSEWLEPVLGFIDGHFNSYGKQDFIDIKNMGVEVVRIPVHFDTFSSGKPDYIVPDTLWNKLDSAVDWSEELKMYVIIDFHNDCNGNSKTPADIEKRLEKIWPQIAGRYKDRSEYVIYEVMNEPHGIDCKKWGKIQGNMIKLIRQIDKKHSIIVGAADWNSVHELLKLPMYDDDNLIYNYHEYSPFLFTHQGASWSNDVKRITGVPFPYDKNKMPPLPADATPGEKWIYNNYPVESSEEKLVEPLDKAVEFVNKRHAALMSNEFGVYMEYAEPEERVNWYRIKGGYLDDRNICRVSWDYRGGFGVFNKGSAAIFPQDLNVELIKAMGYRVPSATGTTWFQNAQKNNSYIIYKDGIAEKILFNSWIPEAGNECSLYKKDSADEESYIYVSKADKYRVLQFQFGSSCDFASLVESGASLEFEIRHKEPNFKMSIYFTDSEKSGLPWRAGIFPTVKEIPADGQWHKVKIPLSQFSDFGAWDNYNQKWHNSQGKFIWTDVANLTFDTADSTITKGLGIKNIVIK